MTDRGEVGSVRFKKRRLSLKQTVLMNNRPLLDSRASVTLAAVSKQGPRLTSKMSSKVESISYLDMAIRAIQALKNRKGASRSEIARWIQINYNKEGGSSFNAHLRTALKKGIESGMLKEGHSAQRFKIGVFPKVVKPKKVSSNKKNASKKERIASKRKTASKKKDGSKRKNKK